MEAHGKQTSSVRKDLNLLLGKSLCLSRLNDSDSPSTCTLLGLTCSLDLNILQRLQPQITKNHHLSDYFGGYECNFNDE